MQKGPSWPLQRLETDRISALPECAGLTRSAAALPRLDGPLALEDHQLSNAALFELLDPWAPPPTCRI